MLEEQLKRIADALEKMVEQREPPIKFTSLPPTVDTSPGKVHVTYDKMPRYSKPEATHKLEVEEKPKKKRKKKAEKAEAAPEREEALPEIEGTPAVTTDEIVAEARRNLALLGDDSFCRQVLAEFGEAKFTTVSEENMVGVYEMLKGKNDE